MENEQHPPRRFENPSSQPETGTTTTQQFRQPVHYQHQIQTPTTTPTQQVYQHQGHQQQHHIQPTTLQNGRIGDISGYPTRIVTQPQPGDLITKPVAINRLGIMTIITGILLLGSGIGEVSRFNKFGDNRAGSGIWGGVIIIVCGVFSLISSQQPRNKALNVINLIMHMLAFIISIAVLTLVALDLKYYDECIGKEDRSRYSIIPLCESKDDRVGGIVLYSLQLLFICVQLAISITIIYLCCRAYQSFRECTCFKNCCVDYPSHPSNVVYHPGSATILQNNNQSSKPEDQYFILTPVPKKPTQ